MAMLKFVVAVLAATGIAFGTAPVASASEDAFIQAISSLNYYAINCPGCAQDALNVGYRVCKTFDSGGQSAAIQAVLKAYNGPGQSNAEYHATLFATYAAHELCPQHDGEIAPI
ncbi:DUF732 domain-containing protein [Mycolicibacterium pallens]|uniref:DUF732 domain-containing protein n=2 Tax=Mycolicibacterium pallens TaxID=370524 RepID=A0ABX8VM90_9MYCO|nr:DUF732 domain-containing protein [Mycolicibacterium pallens]QYL18687.1 DUF732 domain-containing protein [Mycolicibacterium pallens]